MLTIHSYDNVTVDGVSRGTLVNFIRQNPRFPIDEINAAISVWWASVLADRDERLAELTAQKDADKAAALAAKDAEIISLNEQHAAALVAKDEEKIAALAAKDIENLTALELLEAAKNVVIAEKDAIIAAKQAEIDALTPVPVPDGVTVQTPLAILDKMTLQEYAAIVEAAKQSPEVSLWLDKFRAASEVRSDDVRTVQGVGALVAFGFFTTERANEIFGVSL